MRNPYIILVLLFSSCSLDITDNDLQVALKTNQEITINENQYLVKEELGCGGFGVVYHISPKNKSQLCDLALKVLHQENPSKLEGEYKALSKYQHSSIVKGYGVYDNALLMEYIQGSTIIEYYTKTNFTDILHCLNTSLKVLKLVKELAYSQSLWMNDLSRRNIIIDDKGDIKFIDFGGVVHINEDEIERPLGGVSCLTSFLVKRHLSDDNRDEIASKLIDFVEDFQACCAIGSRFEYNEEAKGFDNQYDYRIHQLEKLITEYEISRKVEYS